MSNTGSAKSSSEIESVQRIEPARLEEVPEAITDVVAELSAASAKLGQALHPRTAANLTGLVRIMNSYYSNLIEGHNTRPKRCFRGFFRKRDVAAATPILIANHGLCWTRPSRVDARVQPG